MPNPRSLDMHAADAQRAVCCGPVCKRRYAWEPLPGPVSPHSQAP